LNSSFGKIRGQGKITTEGEQALTKPFNQEFSSSFEHLRALRNSDLKRLIYEDISRLKDQHRDVASAIEALTELISRLEKRFPEESAED
jgi:predicted  nucleic acid-binding Zn-ribbon protein